MKRGNEPRLVLLLDDDDEGSEITDPELSVIEGFLTEELQAEDAELVSRRLLEDDHFYLKVEAVIEELELPDYVWRRLARAMREARAA